LIQKENTFRKGLNYSANIELRLFRVILSVCTIKLANTGLEK